MGPAVHILFVSRSTGYELIERDGEPPAVGAEIELDSGERLFVSRVGRSPLPGDPRPCAYLLSR